MQEVRDRPLIATKSAKHGHIEYELDVSYVDPNALRGYTHGELAIKFYSELGLLDHSDENLVAASATCKPNKSKKPPSAKDFQQNSGINELLVQGARFVEQQMIMFDDYEI